MLVEKAESMINQEPPRKVEIKLEVSIELGTGTFVTFTLPEHPHTQSENYTVQGFVIATERIKLLLLESVSNSYFENCIKDTLLYYLIFKGFI